jgi:hypothetical protein
MPRIRIELESCDGITEVERNVAGPRLAWLTELATEFQAVGGGCTPVMNLLCAKTYESPGTARLHPCEKRYDHTGECGRAT